VKLPSIETLKQLEQEGLIAVQALDDLIIANYTRKCQYDHVWNDNTRVCRGLILKLEKPWPKATEKLELVALPFEKFFNAGEIESPDGDLVEVTEKADGSLGILFRYNGEYRVATRGSFKSEQAQWATEFLKRYDLRHLPANYTLLCEIIYPDNRIVVDYGGREDLILIGIRDRFHGDDFFFPKVQKVAKEFGFSTPKVYTGKEGFIYTRDIVKRAKELDASEEGWVLRFSDGSRLKVKGNRYRELSKLLNHVTPKTLLEALISGTIDDYMMMVPEEVGDEVIGWKREYEDKLYRKLSHLQVGMELAPKDSRKAFANWVMEYDPEDAKFYFQLLDGKDPTPVIYKAMLKDRNDHS
jgi:RNA ligase